MEVIGTIIGTVCSGIILYLIQLRLRPSLQVRRISSSTDSLVPDLLELYQELFPEKDGTNYSTDEVLECMDSHFEALRHVEVENIVFAATIQNALVGFIFCHLYPQRRKAIVSYFAVDKNVKEARLKQVAARKLLMKLKQFLIAGNKCDILFYDIERPGQKTRRKSGRSGVFKGYARALKLQTREYQFAYQCPRISLDETSSEQPFTLFCVGVGKDLPRAITKDQLLEYLTFVHLDCYGDNYAIEDPRYIKHQAYLHDMLNRYREALPDVVQSI